MQKHSGFMNTAGVLILVLLGMWLFCVHGYYFGYGESEGGSLVWLATGNIIDIVRMCLVFSFFCIVRKEYSSHSNTKTALWFAGIAACMLMLSCISEVMAEYLKMDINDMDYEDMHKVESNAYLLHTIAYYLSFTSGLLIIAMMCVYKTLSENRRLAGALIFTSVVLVLNHVQLRPPFEMSDYEAYKNSYGAWLMLRRTLYMGAIAFLFFTYARKDDEPSAADRKISTASMFVALIMLGLAFLMFFTDWVCIEGYGQNEVLLEGGYRIPVVNLGLVLIAASVISLFSGKGRNTCGALLITYVVLLWIILFCVPNEYGIALIDIVDSDLDFIMDDSLEFGNLACFTVFTLIGAIMMFDGGSKNSKEQITSPAENEEIARLKAEIEALKGKIKA